MLEAHTVASMLEAHTVASMLEAHTVARLHSLSQPYGLGVIGKYPVPSSLLNLQSSKKRWMKRGDRGRKERREEERGEVERGKGQPFPGSSDIPSWSLVYLSHHPPQ